MEWSGGGGGGGRKEAKDGARRGLYAERAAVRWAHWGLEGGFGGLEDAESKAGAAYPGAALGITVISVLAPCT